MENQVAPSPHTATISAVIIRADGTIEEVGVVAAGFENPFKQLWWDQVGKRIAARRIRKINKRHAERA